VVSDTGIFFLSVLFYQVKARSVASHLNRLATHTHTRLPVLIDASLNEPVVAIVVVDGDDLIADGGQEPEALVD
jgi:hypothetical protein